MQFSKLSRSIKQISTHVLAIFMGVMLTVTSLRVLPSAAEPGPNPVTEASAKVMQKSSPATTAISSQSFVTAAVNRVGASVVRIDTEKQLLAAMIRSWKILFSGGFLVIAFPNSRPRNSYGV